MTSLVHALALQPLRYWGSGGPLLVPIALASLGIWAYFLRTRRHFTSVVRDSRGLEELASGRNVSCIAELLRRFRSVSGLIAGQAAAALSDSEHSERVSAAMERREETELARLGRDLVVLAAITASAPLLGLLGTVVGMIQTFGAVAGTTGDPVGDVAAGISRALITTQFGLVVAIPGVFGLARLQKQLGHIQVRFASVRIHVIAALRQDSRDGGERS